MEVTDGGGDVIVVDVGFLCMMDEKSEGGGRPPLIFVDD